jgi:hypothetical protein
VVACGGHFRGQPRGRVARLYAASRVAQLYAASPIFLSPRFPSGVILVEKVPKPL